METLRLNERACALVEETLPHADRLKIHIERVPGGGRLLDCGVEAPGGLEAGLFLARLTLSDLAEIALVPSSLDAVPVPEIAVRTDQPVAACLASQYAGWRIEVGSSFAMGSGPMRALAGREPLYDRIGFREHAENAVGALETRALPGEEVFAWIASACGVEPTRVTLAVAPTGSIAGSIQVVARSVETVLHKLAELAFDLSKIESGFGTAPLPPPTPDDLAALGRTNDAVLYGARVVLWVRAGDEELAEIGRRVPSSASAEHGEPFLAIFERHGRDFYAVDPLLFSPAEVVFHNLETGATHRFGAPCPDVLRRSFFA